MATDCNVLCREGERLQTAMCSAERESGYRQQCALHTGSEATDSNVLYREEVWLQTGSEATDRKCGYRQQCALQTGSVATVRQRGLSVKLQWGYLPVLQSPTVACLYRL